MSSSEISLMPLFEKLYSCARTLSRESFEVRKLHVENFAAHISGPDGIQAVYNQLSAQNNLIATRSDYQAVIMKERSGLFPSMHPTEIENLRNNSFAKTEDAQVFAESVSPAFDRFIKDVRHLSKEVGKELFSEDYNERQQMLAVGRIATQIAAGDKDLIDRVSRLSEYGLKDLVRKEAFKPSISSNLHASVPFFKDQGSAFNMNAVKDSFRFAEASLKTPPKVETVLRDVLSKAVMKTPFGVRDNHFSDRPNPVTGVYDVSARSKIVQTIVSALDNKNIDAMQISFHDFSKSRQVQNVPNLYRTMKEAEHDPMVGHVFSKLPETLYPYAVASIGSDVVKRENQQVGISRSMPFDDVRKKKDKKKSREEQSSFDLSF